MLGAMEMAIRKATVAFVRAKRFRFEETVICYLMDTFGIDSAEAQYQLARCVEDGPLLWFGADEAKLGPDKAGETQLRYRYAPNVSIKEKRMEIVNNIEIAQFVSKFRHLRKKNKSVDVVVECLNKLGARRPTKQRFSLRYNKDAGELVVRVKSLEYLPESLRKIAARIQVEGAKSAEATT